MPSPKNGDLSWNLVERGYGRERNKGSEFRCNEITSWGHNYKYRNLLYYGGTGMHGIAPSGTMWCKVWCGRDG